MRPRNQLSPAPEFPERSEQIYEYVEAAPAPRRQGPRYFEAGLWRDGSISGSFVGGASADQQNINTYEFKVVADCRSSRLGAGNPAPSWNHVPQEALANFASAADFGDPG